MILSPLLFPLLFVLLANPSAARDVSTWVAPCASSQCRGVSEWVGSFNLASFSSEQRLRNESSTYFASVLSSFGLPTAVLLSFASPSDFRFTRAWDDSKLEREPRFPTSPVGELAGGLSASLVSVLEFKDEDGDGVYRPESDKLLSEYSLSSPNHKWQPQVTSVKRVAGNHTIHKASVATVDAVGLGVEWGMADADGVSDEERAYDSRSVRMDVTVESYPYRAPRGEDTQLALSVAVMGTYAAVGLREDDRRVTVGDYGRVSWENYAFLDPPSIAPPRLETGVRVSGPYGVAQSTVLFSAGNLIRAEARPSQVRLVYFSLAANRPGYAEFGVKLSIDDAPGAGHQGLTIVITAVLLLVAVAVGGVVACLIKRRHHRWLRDYHRRKAATASRHSTPGGYRLVSDYSTFSGE